MKTPTRSGPIRLALLSAAMLSALAGRSEATGSRYNLTLYPGNRTVRVDNISGFPDSRVSILVIQADRGMVTQNVATHTNVAGLMNPSDAVIVTRYGIYWLDLLWHAGEMAGMWALDPYAPGGLNFKYFANGQAWSPNYLAPGSRGFSDVNDRYFSGFTMVITPKGYSDGQIGGQNGGGFQTSFNRVSDGDAAASQTSAGYWTNELDGLDQNNAQHLYQFIGYMRQLPNPMDEDFTKRVPNWGSILVTQEDAQGNTIRGYYRYVNTYVFYDYTASLVAQQRVRYVSTINTEVIQNPVRMSLQTDEMVGAVTSNLLRPSTTDQTSILPYPSMLFNTGNRQRDRYFGANSVAHYGPYVTGYLDTSQATNQNISHTLSYYRAGYGRLLDRHDFVSACQDGTFNVSGPASRMISMEVPGETSIIRPERHDHILDKNANVLSLNFTYWNSRTTEADGLTHIDGPEFMSSGNPYTFGFDVTMERK